MPYLLKYTIDEGKLEDSQLFQMDAERQLTYEIVLVIMTRGIPVAVLIVTNILLITAVNKAMKRRKHLKSQHSVQVPCP